MSYNVIETEIYPHKDNQDKNHENSYRVPLAKTSSCKIPFSMFSQTILTALLAGGISKVVDCLGGSGYSPNME